MNRKSPKPDQLNLLTGTKKKHLYCEKDICLTSGCCTVSVPVYGILDLISLSASLEHTEREGRGSGRSEGGRAEQNVKNMLEFNPLVEEFLRSPEEEETGDGGTQLAAACHNFGP